MPQRSFGASSPPRQPRREASDVFRSISQGDIPPFQRGGFVTTSGRPSSRSEGSSVTPGRLELPTTVPPIGFVVDTPFAQPRRSVAISLIRGTAGGDVTLGFTPIRSVPPTFSYQLPWPVADRWSRYVYDETPYEPEGGGAFFSTAPRSRSAPLWKHEPLMLWRPQYGNIDPVDISRVFPVGQFVQAPYREASSSWSPQVAPPAPHPYELNRFVTGQPAWQANPGAYAGFDAGRTSRPMVPAAHVRPVEIVFMGSDARRATYDVGAPAPSASTHFPGAEPEPAPNISKFIPTWRRRRRGR